MKYNNMKNRTKKYTQASLRCLALGVLVLCGGGNELLAQIAQTDTLRTKIVHGLFDDREDRMVTSSISSISGYDITGNSVSTLGNVLFGKVPGLMVMQAAGEPGYDSPSFYIRGKHTFTGSNSPMVLVDGYRRDLNTLTVDEVESISVLKDAAATALYGMDGANGIILVTTKRGVEGKTRVNFNAEFGIATPAELPSFYNAYDYVRFYRMAEENDGKTIFTYSDEDIEGYRNKTDNLLYPDVDWIDECILKATPTQKYSVNVQGGNKVAKFFVNLGYSNNKGIYKDVGNKSYNANNDFDRINFRSNMDINLMRNLNIALDIAGRIENIHSPNVSSALIWRNLYTYHPNAAPIYAAPGVWGGTNTYRQNPLAYINDQGYKDTHRRLLQTNLKFEYDFSDFVKGLSAGVAASFDNFYSVANGYSKTYAVQDVLFYDTQSKDYVRSEKYGIDSPLTAFGPKEEQEERFFNYTAFVAYKNRFGNHGVGAKILGRLDSQQQFLSSSDRTGSPDRMAFLSALLSYDYKQKYLIDFAANYGGGEDFMRGKRFGFFPSVSGAWIVSEEDFMAAVTPVTFLKLRASTGLVGNQNVGGTRFGYRDLYTWIAGAWGTGLDNANYSNGSMEAALGNPNLTWEKSFKTDAGIDLTLWHSLDIMANYYYEYRTDILCSGSTFLPDFLGSSLGYMNYGKVAAQGVDFSINFHKQYQKGGFEVGVLGSYQKNKVLRMKEAVKSYDYLYSQGLPIGQRFGLVCEGFYSEDDVLNRDVVQSFGAVIPGSLKYKDVNGDKVVDSNDVVPMGKDTQIGDWELGMNLGANYKGFYFTALLQARIGRDINIRGEAPYAASPLYYDRNVIKFFKCPWTKEVANTPNLEQMIDFPSLTIENGANNFQNSTFFMRNGDFLRLRSLEFGYQFPKKWISKAHIENATVYLRGMNLFTLDHIDGMDPEKLEGYPVMRSYNIGLNVTF